MEKVAAVAPQGVNCKTFSSNFSHRRLLKKRSRAATAATFRSGTVSRSGGSGRTASVSQLQPRSICNRQILRPPLLRSGDSLEMSYNVSSNNRTASASETLICADPTPTHVTPITVMRRHDDAHLLESSRSSAVCGRTECLVGRFLRPARQVDGALVAPGASPSALGRPQIPSPPAAGARCGVQ